MNAASNALGVIAALIWISCAVYFLLRAKSCERSRRVLFAAALVIAAGLTGEVVRAGLVDWVAGLVLLLQAVATALVIVTREGRSAAGLSGYGITRPSGLDADDQAQGGRNA